jgi:8-oxo-dGTP pyrophosphatase MutT (NUDIX family)
MNKSAITVLPCAGLIYIEERKLLLAFSNNKQCFYLPGGKVCPDETAAEALCREIREEMNVTIQEGELSFYTHISAPAYGEHEGIIMEQDCFLLKQAIKPVAAAEIAALQYFSLEDYLNEPNQAPGAIMVLEQLKQEGLID